MEERRDGGNRRWRLISGAASAPEALILAYWFERTSGQQIPSEILIAVHTMIGVGVNHMIVCYWDLHDVARAHLKRFLMLDGRVDADKDD
jgi:hypothetical protein